MEVDEVNVTPVKPSNGLVAFASCVIDKKLFIGSLGVHKRLDGDGYRITFPTKVIGQKQLNYFYPITKAAGLAIERAIVARCNELFERSDEDDRHSKDTDQCERPDQVH